MTPFNGHHIQQFNQRCKHLVGEGKVVLTHKEVRDLNAEIMDLLLVLRTTESSVNELKSKLQKSEEISVVLDGKSF
jgi:predicted  nucleic acid-binding Zn-ribbon protein